MNKEQFLHDHVYKLAEDFGTLNKKNKRTYVFELPEYYNIETELVRSIVDNNYNPNISIIMGIAKCNPKDQYNKKTGRDTATANKKMVNFIITKFRMHPKENEIILFLYSELLRINVKIAFKKEFNNIRVLGVDYSINEAL